MTCADVRHRLLTADLSALRGESDQSLAEHLASCPTCAGAAALIVDQTDRLAAALNVRQSESVARRSRVPRRVAVAIPLAAAAGIALIAILTRRGVESTKISVRSIDTDSAPVAPRPAPASPVRTVQTPTEQARKVERVAPTTAAVAQSEAHVAGDSTPMDPSSSQVGVQVERDQRAVVLATSNPKITVVWLYPGKGQ